MVDGAPAAGTPRRARRGVHALALAALSAGALVQGVSSAVAATPTTPYDVLAMGAPEPQPFSLPAGKVDIPMPS